MDHRRLSAGAGHLDFRAPLAALKRIGYDGWLTLECRILGEDRAKALAESARLIRNVWAEVWGGQEDVETDVTQKSSALESARLSRRHPRSLGL